jgi:uncharacterized coiled-coil DUF342 family protein
MTEVTDGTKRMLKRVDIIEELKELRDNYRGDLTKAIENKSNNYVEMINIATDLANVEAALAVLKL